MQKKTIHLEFTEVDSQDELSKEDNLLVQKSIEASQSSYSPYSHFHVGAAVLLDNGAVVVGNNQENAAYPSSLCAERVALFHAAATNPQAEVETIAIYAFSDNDDIDVEVTPCGACRQAMMEYENRSGKKIRVIMKMSNKKFLIAESVKSLLPLSFDGNHLKK
ncbi:MAG: cytidine deaminase [Bacteroidales bacterium]|nr:cytidine deaminase [Bacteroidales bacterium]